MSAQKMREMVRQIQGLPALQAQAILAVVPRKSARFVAKTLKSAIANAEDQARYQKVSQFKPENLVVRSAVAGTATTIRRFTPKARGSAGPILKRSCHIKIVLSDE
jgi:large subunit ribosomal protein L22